MNDRTRPRQLGLSRRRFVGLGLGLLTLPSCQAATGAGGLLSGLGTGAQGPGHPREKIGIGAWDDGDVPVASFIEGNGVGGFAWHYNWSPAPLVTSRSGRGQSKFIPMIWGADDLGAPLPAGSTEVMAFNEPDGNDPTHQSGISPSEAAGYWPQLEAYGAGVRLGSPGPMQGETLGRDSWLRQFMDEIGRRGHRVDFVCVHYYSVDGEVGAFERFLDAVYEEYGLPIWVTEWALVDWGDVRRFFWAESARFAEEAIPMLQAHPHVERHAWFAALPYPVPWADGPERDRTPRIHAFELDGSPTPVGQAFRAALVPAAVQARAPQRAIFR
jgi:hypothetical protein